MTKEEHAAELAKLNRHQLGIVDLSDAVNIDTLSSSERKSYLEQAELIFANPVFQKEIATLLQEQLVFIGQYSENWEQTLTGRGQISGISLLSERFKELHGLFINSNGGDTEMDEDEEFSVV